MAVPIEVQRPNAVVVSSAASAQLTMPSACAAQNSLVGATHINSGATRSWTVTDTVDAGNWTSTVLYQPTRSFQIHHRHNISAGTPTITWTVNSGTWSGYVWAVEVSGLDSGASPVTGTLSEGSGTANHESASSAVVATDAFVICNCCLNSSGTSLSPGSGYAIAPTVSSNISMIQSKVTASQNDTGPWTSTSAIRTSQGCMAAFPAPASASTRPWTFPRRVGGGFPRRVTRW